MAERNFIDLSMPAPRPKKGGFDRDMVFTVLSLAVPVMFENILHVLLGVVDVYFVGRIGTEAIAGVGITNVIMNIYIAFFLGIGVGTTALISRSVGGGEINKANGVVKQALMLAAGIGLLLGGINVVFSRNILLLLGGDEAVIRHALPYFMTVAVPSVFLCILMTLSSALRGAGDTKTPMRVAIVANIMNVVLDYVLMFGIFSFNGFGVMGAGLATTISRLFSVVVLLRIMKQKKTKLVLDVREKWRIERKIINSILKIGLPAGLEKLFMRLGQLVYVGMIMKLGTEVYAAHSIGGTIETLSYLPGNGFAVAASTLVGQSLGANKPDEAQRYGLLSYFLGAVLMGAIGMLFFFKGSFLAGIFSSDEYVVSLVGSVLKIMGIFEPMVCVTLVITAALQGAGDTRFPMYLTLVGIWGIRVLGIYLLGIKLGLGLFGVWSAISIDIFIRGVILIVRFIKGKWKRVLI